MPQKSTIMDEIVDFGPKRPSLLWSVGPNSTIVVYIWTLLVAQTLEHPLPKDMYPEPY